MGGGLVFFYFLTTRMFYLELAVAEAVAVAADDILCKGYELDY